MDSVSSFYPEVGDIWLTSDGDTENPIRVRVVSLDDSDNVIVDHSGVLIRMPEADLRQNYVFSRRATWPGGTS